ncbi:HlyD family secretion protein [Mucilaginibacter ginkgonis]|uniref:HlyD family efflux transporter periplasmic adaptor subunit n=1 Tax=Mucilaginibacter ginkgonis TaxID=2682091 RepID=A0A6I4IML0_9SPHI|nr:HlyD family efflux transporter periplasmic adaptor subunit [Mucilaginibacter ginkgonis]QQL50455.1 HlyD family efflux transporter periplasmic adaptor subunit [Mucilaginibacter ginkgonis]
MEKTDAELFPADFMALTTEYHFHKYDPSTTLIYRIVLGFTLLALFSMFFIKINVNIKSAGVIKSPFEHNEVKTLVSAKVDSSFLKENMHVKKGQVLVVLKADAIAQKSLVVTNQEEEYKAQLADLQSLTQLIKSKNWSQHLNLKSELYSQQYVLFLQQLRNAGSVLDVAQKNYNRYSYLLKTRAVSAAEYDNANLTYRNALNDRQLVIDGQGTKWQAALNDLNVKMRDIQSTGQSVKEEKDYYTLRAPVSGTLQNVKGIEPGSVIAANEIVAEISPETGLIAEVYVLPKDIGLLRSDTKTNFQIDAYNYNQWGMLSGKVTSISNDIYVVEGQPPYFKVRCKLDDDKLKLKNGYVGRLKKGMSLQANFYVTRRTLFQLLYDKVDNWLNPNKLKTTVETSNTSNNS